METITRKEFIQQVSIGTAALIFGSCMGSCKKSSNTSTQSNSVNFTLDVSTGPLASNGGYVVQNNVIVARTSSGTFVAVSDICTHQGGKLYFTNSNVFQCPLHGATLIPAAMYLVARQLQPCKNITPRLRVLL